MEVNESQMQEFLGKMVGDLGAAVSASLVLSGDKLGLYKALAADGSHTLENLKPDGTCVIVEPFAYDSLAENLNPVGRVYYSFSTTVCTPSALSQEGGMALGAQAGEARIREVAEKAGFTRFRRAAETPFNLIYEARP
jgi:hypothetical protein